MFAFHADGAAALIFFAEGPSLWRVVEDRLEAVPVDMERLGGKVVAVAAPDRASALMGVARGEEVWLVTVSTESGEVLDERLLPGVAGRLHLLGDGSVLYTDHGELVWRATDGVEKRFALDADDRRVCAARRVLGGHHGASRRCGGVRALRLALGCGPRRALPIAGGGSMTRRFALSILWLPLAALAQLQLMVVDQGVERSAGALFGVGATAVGDPIDVSFRIRNTGTAPADLRDAFGERGWASRCSTSLPCRFRCRRGRP